MAGFTDYQRQALINAQSGAMVLRYTFIAQDFAAGSNWVEVIRGPTGLRGKVVDVSLYECTEVFAAGDADARIDIGIEGGDLDAYGRTENIGALAATDAISLILTTVPGVIGIIPVQTNASPQIQITGVDGTTPTTGIATVVVSIAWFI